MWPNNLAVVIGVVTVVIAWVVQSPRSAWVRSGPIATAVWAFSLKWPWITNDVHVRVAVLAAWVALGGLLVIAFAQRTLLRVLLADKSFLYAARSPTLWTKTWFMLVRALTRGRPLLYSFQSSMPRLPVPPLSQTVEKVRSSRRHGRSASAAPSGGDWTNAATLGPPYLCSIP
jgi:hypothetical protein